MEDVLFVDGEGLLGYDTDTGIILLDYISHIGVDFDRVILRTTLPATEQFYIWLHEQDFHIGFDKYEIFHDLEDITPAGVMKYNPSHCILQPTGFALRLNQTHNITFALLNNLNTDQPIKWEI